MGMTVELCAAKRMFTVKWAGLHEIESCQSKCNGPNDNKTCFKKGHLDLLFEVKDISRRQNVFKRRITDPDDPF